MANTDYLCNRIDELENEVATLDEKRNEYQVLSEDLEKELEELKEEHKQALKKIEELSDKLYDAFTEINRLYQKIGTIKANEVIRLITKGNYEYEERWD